MGIRSLPSSTTLKSALSHKSTVSIRSHTRRSLRGSSQDHGGGFRNTSSQIFRGQVSHTLLRLVDTTSRSFSPFSGVCSFSSRSDGVSFPHFSPFSSSRSSWVLLPPSFVLQSWGRSDSLLSTLG